MRTTTSVCLVIAAVLATGCAKPAASPGAASPASTGGEATPAPAEAPATARIVCHLDCSGQEAKGYGATEEEARADVRRHVSDTCNPDDGQHFIFCEPLE